MQSYNISQGKYDKILLSKCWCIALYQPIFLMSLYELSMVMVQKLWADIALVIIKFAILLMIDSIENNWKQKKISTIQFWIILWLLHIQNLSDCFTNLLNFKFKLTEDKTNCVEDKQSTHMSGCRLSSNEMMLSHRPHHGPTTGHPSECVGETAAAAAE